MFHYHLTQTAMLMAMVMGIYLMNDASPFCHPYLQQHVMRKKQSSIRASLASTCDDALAGYYLDPTLTAHRIEELFAWISAATKFNDSRYEEGGPNTMISAIFGQVVDIGAVETDEDFASWLSYIHSLREEAYQQFKFTDCQKGDIRIGPILTSGERERNTLGPLGAGQWSKQQPEKYAHSLLILNGTSKSINTVDDWIQSLPRTCRQTIRKAEKGNCTQQIVVIANDQGEPAPHSTLSHFRCVLQHQVRLAQAFCNHQGQNDQNYANIFFDAIFEGIERFLMSINECGSILEFHDSTSQKVIGYCHLVGKGKVLRGQWFYASDEGSRQLLWFRAVRTMVEVAICSGMEVVDLGPNGVDGMLEAHAKLKEKYGFGLHEDWPLVADYRGSFWTVE